VILDPVDAVGQLARRTIFAGSYLTSRDIEPRVVIQRNQIVAVEMLTGGLQVTTQARALADARSGDVVLCANLNSKEQFQGVARGDGVVEVR
jgi:flagellar basal body P-ring formation protein FlgA